MPFRSPAPWLMVLSLAFLAACIPRGADLWRSAYTSSGHLDNYAERVIIDPDYNRLVILHKGDKAIHWHLAGPGVLRKVCKQSSQCSFSKGGVTHIYNLAGPLPNGEMYLSQWGVGHEWAHVLGINVDYMLLNDDEHPLNILDHKK